MKKIPQLFMLGLVGLVALAACSQSGPVNEVVPAAEPQTTTQEATAPQRDPSDLALVGHTGRPQFLNSFATW